MKTAPLPSRPLPRFDAMPRVVWLTPAGPVQLVEPLVYFDASGRCIVVPAGFTSDLESRPTLLPAAINWLLGTAISTACGAILHDYLYRRGPILRPAIDRRQADALYYEALRATGFGLRRAAGAWLGWTGLRLGGWRAWNASREEDDA